jgi:hypothetical protein
MSDERVPDGLPKLKHICHGRLANGSDLGEGLGMGTITEAERELLAQTTWDNHRDAALPLVLAGGVYRSRVFYFLPENMETETLTPFHDEILSFHAVPSSDGSFLIYCGGILLEEIAASDKRATLH